MPPANLIFLVDVSGSMNQPDKLPLLKSSLRMLVQVLRPQDFVSIVTYAGHETVSLPPTSGAEKQRIPGISLSTLGFGAGNYHDELMEQLADVDDGSYSYIDSLGEGRKVLQEQVLSTLHTIAKASRGQDPAGYRADFVALVHQASALKSHPE